jgi:TM2 domain-containing membrane protein YozV
MEDMRRQEVRELARLTARLTAAQQAFFQGEYGRHRRSPTTALLLCLLLGGFGGHYFYFGRHRAGLWRLLLSWTLVPAVLALFEARTIGARAMRYNASLANELLLAMSETVHEQPREVDALESLSAPMALPVSPRAALYAPEGHDSATESAEAALIAAAYAGRESANGAAHDTPEFNASANGHSGTLEYQAEPRPGASGAGALDDQCDVAVPPRLPASEYDTWYDSALHAVPEPAANGHAHGALTDEAAATGPDAPHWVPVPEWSVAAPAAHTAPVDDWAMPDLDRQGAGAATTYPQIAAADLLDGSSFGWGAAPAETYGATPNPGVAAAAAGAAAAWADQARPLSTAESANDRAAREPAFMYQVAPAVRRPSAHLGPPAPGAGNGDWPTTAAAAPSIPRRIGEDVGLASLGSLLAAGLADLLRERQEPLRTRPLTQPVSAPAAFAPAPALSDPRPISGPLVRRPVEPEDPWAVSDSIRAPLTESPHLAPMFEELSTVPPDDAPAAAHHDWLAAGALAASGTALAGSAWEHVGAHEATARQPVESFETSVTDEPFAGAAAAVFAAPAEQSGAVEPAPKEPLVATPPAYASTPSEALRRRINHRLFVRKMAVLEGKVVAESSVERQVELVDDDAVMAERVRQATNSAAREALANLLQLAPPEALPAIRAQLLSLDLDAN